MQMNSVCSEQSLADKFSKLNSTQQCVETLSHWCIFHRSKAELVVSTWAKQFHSLDMVHKVPLLYLANDILQNSKRKGNEFVTEFWKVLPSALKEVVSKGDERGKNVVSRLVGIWEERRVFGSHSQSLKDVMLGEEMPPPLELRKKRSRPVRLLKKDSRSIKTKLSIGGPAEKIVSAFHVVLSENTNEDEEMGKCRSAVDRVKKMERDVDVALTKAKDPSRKTLSKELEEEENLLKQYIEKLKGVETNRVALVSQLRDALHEQESELENLRTQMQVAQAQVEEAKNMRTRLDDENRVFDPKPLTSANDKTKQTSKKSTAAIAAEVADKLAASTSSQYIMSSVLSTFAAQEAQSAGLTTSKSENPNNSVFVNQSQNNNPSYQSIVVGQPLTQIPNSQTHYQSIPNNNPPSLQYIQQQQQQQQQPAGGLYEYGGIMPPQPGAPSYMVSPMVPLMPQQPQQMTQQQPQQMTQQQPQQMMQQQMLTMGHQQQSQQPPTVASFRPLAPGMVYYTHPYRSQ